MLSERALAGGLKREQRSLRGVIPSSCNAMEKNMTKLEPPRSPSRAFSLSPPQPRVRRRSGAGIMVVGVRGIGIGAGIAAGALIGSAVAARPYGYYGEPGYAYAEPGYAYAQPYAYDAGPAYYGSYGYRILGLWPVLHG